MQVVESVFYVEPGYRIAVTKGDFISVAVELVSVCSDIESVVWVAAKTGVPSAIVLHNVFLTVLGGLFVTAFQPCSSLYASDFTFAYFAAHIGR